MAEYEASALFTLKPATATASGGKTLLVPTPFAIKMALLDAACRLEGQAAAEEAWGWLGNLTVALRPAPHRGGEQHLHQGAQSRVVATPGPAASTPATSSRRSTTASMRNWPGRSPSPWN
ncbi:MAG: hypothetical protein M5U05_18250 [Anaerolineales bacterium]|nr:hypothetical protein [Anaerolineales bacterium]